MRANTPHRRLNPLTGEWVLVSPHRMNRPWQGQKETLEKTDEPEYDPNCYLCPGNVRAAEKKNPNYKSTYVFTNDFPAIFEKTLDLEDSEKNTEEIFLSMEVYGLCRVICYSPNHRLTLPEMEQHQIFEVVRTWIDQSFELGGRYRWVQIFENKGEVMGCSNKHPHGQIWASDQLPTEAEKEQQNQVKYLKKYGKSLLHSYAKSELESRSRIVEYNSSWLAVVPYWAVWPFETLLLPLRAVQRLVDLNLKEQNDLAEILKRIITRYDNIFETSFPYSMGWHGAPMDEESPHWQLHAHFFPPLLRSSGVKKFMVGYEMLAEAQRDITPEEAAERLRKVSKVHYKQTL